jgi:hypothetical protein
MFQPHHTDAILVRFLDRQMNHRVTRISAMPVPFARFNPNRIAGRDYLRWSARELHTPDSSQHMQSLPHGVRMPRSPRHRFEGNAIHRKSCGRSGSYDLINPHRAREPILRPLAATAHLIRKYFHFFFPAICHYHDKRRSRETMTIFPV